MGIFGDRLRREREMRGITLDEICESTKIARRHLEALEHERFEQLPGGVFNKGFVRAYARFLGLDEDEAVADYTAASHEQPEPEGKFPLEIHEEPDRQLNPRTSYIPLIFALAALAGILVGYFFWLKSKPAGNGPAAPTQQASPVPESSPRSATPSPVPEAVSQPGAAAPAPAGAGNGDPASVQKDKESAQKDSESVQREKKPLVQSFAVLIRAKEDSWVSVVADGKSVMQKTLAADQSRIVKAGKQIVLRTGNAGGIDVSYNGKFLGALGNENEPRTLTFNSSGLVQ